MREMARTIGVISGDVAIAPKAVAVGDQAFQAHWSPWWQRLGADAHLGTKAVAEAISKP